MTYRWQDPAPPAVAAMRKRRGKRAHDLWCNRAVKALFPQVPAGAGKSEQQAGQQSLDLRSQLEAELKRQQALRRPA